MIEIETCMVVACQYMNQILTLMDGADDADDRMGGGR